MKKNTLEIEVKVGIFIALGLGLLMLSVTLLGGAETLLSRHNEYVSYFETVEGLIPGAKVQLKGIQVGLVESIDFDSQNHQIKVTLSVSNDYAQWIKSDLKATIATQGVLGDKFLLLSGGSIESPILSPNGQIQTEVTAGINGFIDRGGRLLESLNSIADSMKRLLNTFEEKDRSRKFFKGMADTAENLAKISTKVDHQLDGMKLKESVNHLESILKKIDRGTGSVGALINDPALYDDVKALIGGANRNRVVRNLVRQAVKDAQ